MKKLLQQFLQRDAPPFIQFVKYGIFGVLATGVDFLLFFILAWKVFPALLADDFLVELLHLPVETVNESQRAGFYALNKTIAFLFSNTVAYLTNFYWVFQPGRHSRKKEIFLFFAVSTTSYALGTAVGTGLIQAFAVGTTWAYLCNGIASVMINYAGRKFFVFKG